MMEREGSETGDPRERRWIARAADGDGRAFERLVNPYAGRLFGFLARSCGDDGHAEDLLQETLVRAWKALPTYVERGRFAAWLFAIATNLARDAARRRRSAPRPASPAALARVPGGTAPDEAFEARETARRLEEALAGLPVEQREIFLLRQHSELTFREIAEARDEPLGTVLSRMHRAVATLRAALGEIG